MVGLADAIKFTPASAGTVDFVYSSTVAGFRSPVSNLTDAVTYHYRAESADLSSWEIGVGTWTASSSTLARTTVLYSSTGSKVNFAAAPRVAVVALAQDIVNKTGDTMTGSLTVPNASGLSILDTDASHTLGIVAGSNLTANRTLTVTTGDASRTITLGGDFTTNGAYAVTLTLTATSTLTMPAGTKTLAALQDANTWSASQSIQGGLTLTSSTAYNPQINATHDSNTAGSAGYVILNRARAGMTDVQAGDTLGTFGVSGYFNTALRFSGYFAFSVDGSPSGTTVPVKLVYTTVSGGNAFAIDASGNVGIKTTSPTVPLEVNGTAKATTLNLTNALDVAYGGTGSTSLTANNVLLGNGTSAVQVVAPGTSGNVLTSNGTTWTSAAPSSSGGKAADQQVFTGSGTWTKPSGFGSKAYVLIQAWGGGGGGARHSTAANAAGGGGGGYKERWILLSSLGATETVTIAAGGTGRITSNGDGTAGGNTTFGSWVTAYGGGAGTATASGGGGGGCGTYAGPAGGAFTSVARDFAVFGPWMGAGGKYSDTATYPTTGLGDAVYGGAGGGAGATNTTGGTSQFGGNGGTGGASPTAGSQPGGGGGAGASTNGKDGGAGKVIVTVFDGA